ncbi:MAG TPA: hypothetical protein VE291_02195 [Terracidiphilus sp.]|nr:hypothetical protein [Terracidiphilus sp.]
MRIQTDADREKLIRLKAEIQKRAEADPEFARIMAVAERVMEEYRETLEKLADS